MGINLSDLVPVERRELNELTGQTLAIDAYNAIYQFLSIIRGPDGTPLKDGRGRVTSHLTGLLYRNINLLEAGVRPAYVFDGHPHVMKAQTLAERAERRSKAHDEWKEAVTYGDIEKARTKATQSSRISNDIVATSRILLTYLGIPVVQAPEEGEAQAAHMAARGDVWAASSQDYDSLLFGAPRLVRNLNISGRRKMPGSKEYRDISIEVVDLQQVLAANGLADRTQLIDLALLVGTDYNPGIRGIGPKKGLKLIKEHSSLERALEAIGETIPDREVVREIFLRAEHTDEYALEWRPPQREKVIEFMCGEHEFSEARVNAALDRLEGRKTVKRPVVPPKSQSSLDMYG
jgi:flap endonuclease-1